MRWLTIVVAVLGLALVGAGCGGGDDEAAADTETVLTDTVDTDETTTEDTTTDDDLDDTSVLASEDCLALANAGSTLGSALSSPGGGVEESEAFQELADRVPDEIRDDYQVLADAYAEYADVLADIDVEEGEIPSAEDLQAIQQAIASIDRQAVTDASANVTAWVTANCQTG